MKQRIRLLMLVLAAAGALLSTGCSNVDDTETVRPWNGPRSWETGLPSGLTEGR